MSANDSLHASIVQFLDSAKNAKTIATCPDCGCPVEYRPAELTFAGQTWEIPLPFCPMCNPLPTLRRTRSKNAVAASVR